MAQVPAAMPDAKEMLELAAEKGLTINLAYFGFEISDAEIARDQSRMKHRKQGYSHANASRIANYAAQFPILSALR
jgi:hypothetical protein